MIQSPVENILNVGGENYPNLSDMHKGLISPPFALIYKGRPTSYSSYSRSGIGYNTDETEVAENLPMSDTSEGLLKYFNYAGVGEFDTEVQQSYLSIRNEDNDPNFAYKPFRALTGVSYGLYGMFSVFNGGGEGGIGKITLEKFKTKSLASQINLFLDNDDVPFIWIDATTGTVNITDGLNTCTTTFQISINENYKIEFVWGNFQMKILINNFIRASSDFSGGFDVGEFLKYCDSGNYHTVRNILFSNKTRVGDYGLLDNLYQPITTNTDIDITR